MTFRKIYAPDVDTLFTNSAVFRLYAGQVNAYATLSPPLNHHSLYGLVWTLPSRLSGTFQTDVGPTGRALSELDTLHKRGMLAAHTLIIKPLYPEVYADPDLLLPPELRPMKNVWWAETGAPAGERPSGTSLYWVEKEVAAWSGALSYVAGDVAWHKGFAWVATGTPTGEPGVDPTWEKVPVWDPAATYPADSHVVLAGTGVTGPGPGGGGGGSEDRSPVSRPPGGDIPQVTMRGVTYDGTYIWMVDNGPKAILRGTPAPAGSGRALDSWFDWRYIQDDNTTTVVWSAAALDPQIELRDITFDGTHLWVVRQDNETLLKIDRSTGDIVQVLALSSFTPLAIAWDGTQLWVHSVAQGQIVVMDRDGVTQFVRPHPWTDANLSGMGWDVGAEALPETIQPSGGPKVRTRFEEHYITARRLLAGGGL